MLQMCLQNSTTAECRDLPARDFVRLMGPSVRTPGHRELARLDDKGWRVGEDVFDTLRFDSPATIRFVSGQRRSDNYGPFEAVRVVGDEVHVKNGSHYVLAEIRDDRQGWQCGDEAWSFMVVMRSLTDGENA
jgi:hypothetical protein